MISPQPSRTNPIAPIVFRLSSLSAYSTWGELIAGIKKHHSLTQEMIATASESFFLKAGMPILKPRIYGDMERGRRAPYFGELEPLFRTFVEVYRIEFSDLEITAYVHLAKERIARKNKRIEQITDQQWEELMERLFRINQTRRTQKIHLIRDDPAAERRALAEDPESRRLKAVERLLHTDTAHLLEREAWVSQMLAYPEATPQKKLVVVQGPMGIGKSYAQALLTQHLAAQAHYYLIPYAFATGESQTPEDHLDVFLATLTADLTMITGDETKQLPLDERIKHALLALKERNEQEQKVVLLLDDAQCIFPSASTWSPAWSQFFESFVREAHGATMFLMTRTWPGWEDRRLAYIEETELAELSPDGSVAMWRRSGFEDVQEELLREASRRCGYNPQLMDMLITQCKKRSFISAWGRGGGVSPRETKSSNAQRLQDLLAQDTMFDLRMDVKARSVLQRSLTSRLSHLAVQMLACLSLSPLGLPFSLLVEEFPRAEEAFNELVSASAVDLSEATAQRAAIVPLIREAQWQSLSSDGRKDGIDQRVTDLYMHWLMVLQDFRDDSEKSALVVEMIVRYMRQRQLLKAAELFISYGWLCAHFGHIMRIQRVYDEIITADRGKPEDPRHEAGRLLLSYHLPTMKGEKVNLRARDADFHHIRDLVLNGAILLQPHAEVYLANALMQRMVHEKRYQDAYTFLHDTMKRVAQTGIIDSEVGASFLHNKANLLGRWSSYAVEIKKLEEADRLRRECVDVLTEVVSTWRSCLINSLPVQEHYYQFKLARALNDLAYYSRLLGRLREAEEAITECLYLKDEKKATLPRSLAVSLGEYAQILVAQGRFQEADEKNAQAIDRINQIFQAGDVSACADKGMLLVERANIYEMQGRLDEAKQLFSEALSWLNEDRDEFRFEAKQHLEYIQSMEENSTHYHMDRRWFERYHTLAKYDDLKWLAQAGSFTPEEQQTWDRLYPQHQDPQIWRQLAELIKHSKQREFEQSAAEGRVPRIFYPAIDIEDISARLEGFSELQKDIEREERNPIVRRLYSEKIEEHRLTLRLVEATYKHDMSGVRACNEALYGEINEAEMIIALREFFKMLKRAQSHPQARELAEQLLKQFKQWKLFAEDFLTDEDKVTKYIPQKRNKWRTTPVSSRAVQKLYEEAFDAYGFTEWRVILSPERDTIALDLDLCGLYLPTNDHFTVLSSAELLAEEIETHIRRSVSGKRSKLALLSSGTRGYLPTEEGLAAVAIEEMMEVQGLGPKNNSWVTTLSPGMAAGVLTPPLSFEVLYDLFGKAFLANHLQSGRYETTHEAETDARYDALVRISRTFRGVSDLEAMGVCNLKDRVYLQGYREIKEDLKVVPKERFFVGSISRHDLKDMAELHILEPVVKPLYLAHNPELFEKITSYEQGSRA